MDSHFQVSAEKLNSVHVRALAQPQSPSDSVPLGDVIKVCACNFTAQSIPHNSFQPVLVFQVNRPNPAYKTLNETRIRDSPEDGASVKTPELPVGVSTRPGYISICFKSELVISYRPQIPVPLKNFNRLAMNTSRRSKGRLQFSFPLFGAHLL